ncbi:MAG: Ig-like domain-containing protein [Bifidobacteriaceae bacterium]|jgi:alpha-tubulin suppressor-like RCC1 family protein|nr:Ig-like domain-containing protein [Bifidobacteriaceae bacterium]
MVPLKSLITVACTMALIAAAALTSPPAAHSDDAVFGPDSDPADVAARLAAASNASLVVMPDGEICSWGRDLAHPDGSRQTPTTTCIELPDGVPATSISAESHAVAVGADGVAYTWGSIEGNVAYEGNESHSADPLPVKMPVDTPVIAVSAGFQHTAVLTSDGAIYTSGDSGRGRLGDGKTPEYDTSWKQGWESTKVAAEGLTFTAVAAGYEHTLALSDQGEVYAWGADFAGQLGPQGAFKPWFDFDDINSYNVPGTWRSLTPVKVTGLPPITQVAAGNDHSVALSADGHVWTWGWNSYGQLGNGKTTRFSNVPVEVPIDGVVVGIAAGWGTTLAWTQDGRLFGWGHNEGGVLGLGTPLDVSTPHEALGIRVMAATTNGSHTLAIGMDGQIYTYGNNWANQLGSEEEPFATEPQLVTGLPGPIAYVAAGDSSTLAITETGEVYTWGYNGDGQLGTGDRDGRLFPTRVEGVPPVIQADFGQSHTAALTASGEAVWAWGSNTKGELGHEPGPLQEPSPTPVHVALPHDVGPVASVGAGNQYTMLRTQAGDIWGWGDNDPSWFNDPPIGDQPIEDPPNQVPVPNPVRANVDLEGTASALSVGALTVAVALVSGTLHGFGYDPSCQIGRGHQFPQDQWHLAKPITGLPVGTIVQADTGDHVTMALDTDGYVWTAGNNYSWTLGRPDEWYYPQECLTPQTVDELPAIGAVAAGGGLAMALSQDRSEVYTWGMWDRTYTDTRRRHGDEYIPVKARGLPGPIKQIAAGTDHAVALTDSGEVYTWGNNKNGQLGVVSSTWVPLIRVSDLQFWDPPETPSPTPSDTGSTAPTNTASPTPSDTGSAQPSDTSSPTPSDTGSPTPTDTGTPTPSNTASTPPTDTTSEDPGGQDTSGEDGSGGTDPGGSREEPDDTSGPDAPPGQDTARANDANRSGAGLAGAGTAGAGTAGAGSTDLGAASIGGSAPRGTTPRIARFGTRFKTVVIPAGTTAKLKVAAYPASGTATGVARVTWKTSKASVATPVTGKKTGSLSWRTGTAATLGVKAQTVGRSQITLTSPGARPATIEIKVVPKSAAKTGRLRTVKLTGPGTLAAGHSTVLKPVLAPLGAIRTSARWRSTNPAVATVNAVGRVTGTAAGKTDIVLTVGGKTATKTITVTP